MVSIVRPKEAQIVKVILRFHNGRENYFKTKPFQPDYEEFFEPEKQNQVWFETIINKELVQQLVSYLWKGSRNSSDRTFKRTNERTFKCNATVLR